MVNTINWVVGPDKKIFLENGCEKIFIPKRCKIETVMREVLICKTNSPGLRCLSQYEGGTSIKCWPCVQIPVCILHQLARLSCTCEWSLLRMTVGLTSNPWLCRLMRTFHQVDTWNCTRIHCEITNRELLLLVFNNAYQQTWTTYKFTHSFFQHLWIQRNNFVRHKPNSGFVLFQPHLVDCFALESNIDSLVN